ncbi:MAG: PaaI family thioesterase [Flavobacteriia bacterium]|nr:PaaI family thioesterase [Flavobacteriia bacterium]
MSRIEEKVVVSAPHILQEHPIIQLYQENNQFGKNIGIHFKIIDRGLVEYYGQIIENKLATPIAAHGGFTASLCDGALGIAALTLVAENNQLVSTVEMNIKFLKPILLCDNLKAIGKVISAGKRIIFSVCDVYNQKEELVAHATGTFNAYPIDKSKY